MKKNLNWVISFLLVCLISLSVFPMRTAAEDTSADSIEIDASAALLVDGDHDQILYQKDANEKRYPASITKVMTALLVMEAIERGELTPNTMITASNDTLTGMNSESSTQNIQPGEQMSVENLLYCLLCASANEAANILAEAVSGSIPAFVDAMNAKAQELGMTDTHFVNPHGMHDNDHYTTAWDVYLMAHKAMTYPLFRQIVATADYTVPATNLSGARHIINTNALLTAKKYPGYTYTPTIGIKTGSTPEAGYCLVSAAKQNDLTVYAVVLGAANVPQSDGSTLRKQFSESRRLLKWGLTGFTRRTILDSNSLLREIPVKFSRQSSCVIVKPETSLEATVPNSFDSSLVETTVNLPSGSVAAPIKEGQKLGTANVTYNGIDYGTVNLVATTGVSFSPLQMVLSRLGTLFCSSIVKILLVVALILFLLFLYRRSAGNRRPGKSRKLSSPETTSPKKRTPAPSGKKLSGKGSQRGGKSRGSKR